jgi:hypothetical protein
MSAEANALLVALDAAPDAAAREAVLASTSDPEVLAELAAAFEYRRMNAEIRAQLDAERAAFAAFTRELDAAPDDAARLKAIAAAESDPLRGKEFTQEWVWRRGAIARHWAARYAAMLRPAGGGA